VLSK